MINYNDIYNNRIQEILNPNNYLNSKSLAERMIDDSNAYEEWLKRKKQFNAEKSKTYNSYYNFPWDIVLKFK